MNHAKIVYSIPAFFPHAEHVDQNKIRIGSGGSGGVGEKTVRNDEIFKFQFTFIFLMWYPRDNGGPTFSFPSCLCLSFLLKIDIDDLELAYTTQSHLGCHDVYHILVPLPPALNLYEL
jgi:hypothetical protein